MSQISPEELAKRISSADIELLVAMDKMSSEDDKSKRFQVLMTATLATIAGFAIFISSLFPEMSKYVIAILSAIFGVITIALSFYQHKI